MATNSINNMSGVDELYKTFFDLLDMAVFALDEGKRFVHISPGIEQIIGFRPDELVGTPLHAYVMPEDRSVVDALLNIEPGPASRCDAGIIGKDSSVVRCVILHHRKVNGGEAFSMGIIGRAPVLAAEAEEKLKVFTMVVEQSPATVVITDRHGTIEYVNPKFSNLTGYSRDEALGQNPRILKSGVQPAEFYRHMWETISSGREWQGEFHNRKKNGDSYWESASISPILDSGGEITHYVAIKEDITKRKRTEEALRASEEELRDKNNGMEEELKYAQVVVERLLPEMPPAIGNLKIDFRYNPLAAIGGDYFSFNTLHERCLGIFIGDVPGHGVSAALYLSLVRTLTNRLNWVYGKDPVLYMKTLNDELLQSKEMMFLSALYGYFDFSKGRTEFHFAKGGHPPPVLYRAADRAGSLLQSGGMLVGLSPTAEFEEIRITLAPGDRIYLYTDGVIEARNASNVMLDPEGLEAIVAGSGALSLSETLDHIIDEAGRFRDSKPLEDDLVLVGFEAL
jgi:sigma-B regulation protein RsbU (phosphoserine phosphatase)